MGGAGTIRTRIRRSGGAWRNLSFRAYAQYTRTPQFQAAIDELLARATRARVVICCSEAVPWRCHRWIVSDVLVAQGVEVLHVISASAPRSHTLNPFAHVKGACVTWPAEQQVAQQATPATS